MDYVSGETFFDVLDNGVIVCHLGKVIQDKVKEAIKAGLATGVSIMDFFRVQVHGEGASKPAVLIQ